MTVEPDNLGLQKTARNAALRAAKETKEAPAPLNPPFPYLNLTFPRAVFKAVPSNDDTKK